MRPQIPTHGIPQDPRDPDDTPERVRAERDFLAERLFEASWFWVGRSSDAMTEYAVFGNEIQPHQFPYDWGDYARCVNTYRRAPEHLLPAMLRVLGPFKEFVANRYPDDDPPKWMGEDPTIQYHAPNSPFGI